MRKLYKSTKDKVYTGVIGGVSETLNIDSGGLRFIFFIITLSTSGFALLVYLAAALLLPTDEEVHLNE
ncbi:PspC domain-containing protein [Alkalihalobacillus sp. R86527]|uniref:PspC domain-containing protein n=1 Tax=Alkalihalobacillus sp. R86527 TaxID=3093863 RepID=UPI00366D1A90